MKSKLFRYTSLLIGLLMIAGLFFGAMTTKVAAVTKADTLTQDDSSIAVSSEQAAKRTDTNRLWTKERMLAAKPYPTKPLSGDRSTMTNAPEIQVSESVFKPSSLPMDARPQMGIEPDLGVFSSPSPQGYAYPGPFTRYTNFDSYTRFPYVTVGKLFFTQYGIDYVCSASSIGNYAIWTAGHCVHYGDGSADGWSYNVAFVPAYKNGNAPKGIWYAKLINLWSLNGWINNGDFRYDMGGAVLNRNSGYKISQIVGNLGFNANAPVNKHWFQMGYPAASPFNGLLQIINASSYAYSDGYFGSPYPICVGSDLTGGSSGGPWIQTFRGSAGASNYLNGNNSYRWSGYPKEMCSPYFGDGAVNLFNALFADTP